MLPGWKYFEISHYRFTRFCQYCKRSGSQTNFLLFQVIYWALYKISKLRRKLVSILCILLSTGLAACYEEEESVNMYIHICEWKDSVTSITKPRHGSLAACLLWVEQPWYNSRLFDLHVSRVGLNTYSFIHYKCKYSSLRVRDHVSQQYRKHAVFSMR